MSFYGKAPGIFGGGGGGGGSGGTPIQEAPAGAVPGSTFVLSQTPTDNAKVLFWVDGSLWYQGVEYTIAGSTITTGVALGTGQLPWVYYEY